VVGAGCALTTVLHGVEHTPIELGDVVVIQGAGPVGLAAVAVAMESGASKVVVIGAPRERLELAREFGAQAVVSIHEAPGIEARRQLVLKETGQYGADVVLECVGRPEAVPEGWELCRDGGRCLVLGQYANSGSVTFSPHTITRKQLQISGSWGFEPRHVDLAVRLLENPRWQGKFAREVTHRFPLADANSALQTARSQTAGKVVILP
jgi:threonine dehydrogenase-like Zn-dependent dehydrogenase